MTRIESLIDELEREGERSRRLLGNVPDAKQDWKPHDRSMAFGPLVQMVATIPSWVAMQITMNELDVAPAEGSQHRPAPMNTSEALLKGLETALAQARQALAGTTEEFLDTPWRLLARGAVVMEQPRHVMIRETLSHWAHHRGQATVYLRLMGAKVPALYGPSADDPRFT